MSRVLRIAVLPGDGIGAEVIPPAVDLVERALERQGESAVTLRFETHPAGAAEYVRGGDALPERTLTAARACDAVFLGAMGLPSVRYPSGTEVTPQIDLRERLQLYAGLRPIRLITGAPTPLREAAHHSIDFVIVRESTEGLFAGRHESRTEHDAVLDTMRISRTGSERLFHRAFELARSRQTPTRRPHVTCVDKANVLPSLAFFRRIFEEVARDYPDVGRDCLYVDAAGLQMVRAPWQFDVLVTENMFGDILSDVGAGLIGGMGMAPSADVGDEHAVFQPAHGSAPDIAGRGVANPTATILSGAMMLEWLGQRHHLDACIRAGAALRQAVDAAFAGGDLTTCENGGSAGTVEVVDRVSSALAS